MKLAMVGIIVKDIPQSLAFYKRLGLELDEMTGKDYAELRHEGIRISLNTKKMIAGIYGFIPKNTGDKIELAFEMDSPQEIDKLCQDIHKEGYEVFKEPWEAYWGQYYAIVRDPDNNLISLFCNH